MFLDSGRYRSIALLLLLTQCVIQMAFPRSLRGYAQSCTPPCNANEICSNSKCVTCLHVGGDCSGESSTLCCDGLSCQSSVNGDNFICDKEEPEPEPACTSLGGDCSGDNYMLCCSGFTCQLGANRVGSDLRQLDANDGLTCAQDIGCTGFGGGCSSESSVSCCQGMSCRLSADKDGLTCIVGTGCTSSGLPCSGESSTLCCDDLSCQSSVNGDNFICDKGEPEPACLSSGMDCSEVSDCCSRHACAYSTRGGKKCCGMGGAKCTTSDYCCDESLCTDSGTCCNKALYSCRNQTDCALI